jgi:1,4-dihydroxy-2-naphthoyl-CoA hydrolase
MSQEERAGNFVSAGLDTTLGFEFVRATSDEVIIEYTVAEQHCQPYGIIHGGTHCAAVESACSTGAGLFARTRGQSVVGIENHTSFIRAARTGRIRVRATPITRGRRAQVWEATARNERDQIVATGRVRLLCLEPGTELAGEQVPERR